MGAQLPRIYSFAWTFLPLCCPRGFSLSAGVYTGLDGDLGEEWPTEAVTEPEPQTVVVVSF
jgi:hypothetical protein